MPIISAYCEKAGFKTRHDVANITDFFHALLLHPWDEKCCLWIRMGIILPILEKWRGTNRGIDIVNILNSFPQSDRQKMIVILLLYIEYLRCCGDQGEEYITALKKLDLLHIIDMYVLNGEEETLFPKLYKGFKKLEKRRICVSDMDISKTCMGGMTHMLKSAILQLYKQHHIKKYGELTEGQYSCWGNYDSMSIQAVTLQKDTLIISRDALGLTDMWYQLSDMLGKQDGSYSQQCIGLIYNEQDNGTLESFLVPNEYFCCACLIKLRDSYQTNVYDKLTNTIRKSNEAYKHSINTLKSPNDIKAYVQSVSVPFS